MQMLFLWGIYFKHIEAEVNYHSLEMVFMLCIKVLARQLFHKEDLARNLEFSKWILLNWLRFLAFIHLETFLTGLCSRAVQ